MHMRAAIHPLAHSACLVAWLLAAACARLAATDDLVWVEGESASDKQVQVNSWYDQQVKKDLLSDGAWVTNFGSADGLVTYQVAIPADGKWRLWVRANPIAKPAIALQVDKGDWQELDFSKPVDVVNVAADDKPDMRFVAWIKGPELQLTTGAHTLTYRLHGGTNHHGAIDCFLLSTKPVLPSGKTPPGQKLGTKEEGWFAFEPDRDPLTSGSAIDLSSLNEKRAGEKGFLKQVDDHFELGDGSKERFWAANVGTLALIAQDDNEIEYLAARLAKNGFNMVRLHGGIQDRSGSDSSLIHQDQLVRLQRAVDIFNSHGVYVLLSGFYPLWMTLRPADGIEGAALGKNPFAILFFEPKFQSLYRAWMKAILTTKDPATGKSLSEDPGVGIVEINNEDNLLFWTFGKQALGPGPYRELEGQFAAWLARKYGSLDKAAAAWPGEMHPDDHPDQSQMGIYDAWSMTRDGMAKSSPGRRARMVDQIDFLAQTQHDFYVQTAAWLRSECGVRCPITGSNWTTCDNVELGTLDRWTYTGAGVIDKHGYFGGPHQGERAGYMVMAGDTYADRCSLLDPTAVPIGYHQIAHHPNIHTEVAWNKPNRYIADMDLMLSAYGSVQDMDAFFLFATSNGNWLTNGEGVWTLMMPGELGQSPAEALQFRRGDIPPGGVVRRFVTSEADLMSLKGSGFVEGANADFSANSHGAMPSTDPDDVTAFDPLSYFVGRVETSFDATDKPIAIDLGKFVDRATKTVESAGGGVKLDWGQGLLTVDTARSQAASGFLSKGGAISLGAISISSPIEYGTIHVISLDDQPITVAKRILVQAFTEEKMEGWRAVHGRIQDVGHPPILIRDLAGTVRFAQAVAHATLLDGNGYPAGPAQLDGPTLTLARDHLYVLVTR